MLIIKKDPDSMFERVNVLDIENYLANHFENMQIIRHPTLPDVLIAYEMIPNTPANFKISYDVNWWIHGTAVFFDINKKGLNESTADKVIHNFKSYIINLKNGRSIIKRYIAKR